MHSTIPRLFFGHHGTLIQGWWRALAALGRSCAGLAAGETCAVSQGITMKTHPKSSKDSVFLTNHQLTFCLLKGMREWSIITTSNHPIPPFPTKAPVRQQKHTKASTLTVLTSSQWKIHNCCFTYGATTSKNHPPSVGTGVARSPRWSLVPSNYGPQKKNPKNKYIED